MVDGFLGRWSQRKQAVREGQALDEPTRRLVTTPSVAGSIPAQAPVRAAVAQPPLAAPTDGPQAAPPVAQAPPLSLDDVKNLNAESDFSPFIARDVSPEVRNAAMKKLFADPHYNVMDRLDIYIDDYSKPDPLPESMLRQMASAKFLNLFEDEAQEEKSKAVNSLRDDAHTLADHSVAQSSQLPLTGATPPTQNTPQALGSHHDHTDLRLQPNDAAGPQEPGRSTE